MRFVYQGVWKNFMGRCFAFGKSVDITDKATIEAIRKRTDFTEVKDVKETKNEEEVKAPAKTVKAVLSDECPKCGRIVKRGKFAHQKWCKGK